MLYTSIIIVFFGILVFSLSKSWRFFSRLNGNIIAISWSFIAWLRYLLWSFLNALLTYSCLPPLSFGLWWRVVSFQSNYISLFLNKLIYLCQNCVNIHNRHNTSYLKFNHINLHKQSRKTTQYEVDRAYSIVKCMAYTLSR